MKKITLSNEFHNTEATVIPQEITEGRFKGFHMISRATARKLKNKLCGSTDCTCGDSFGSRGGVHLDVINEDYDRSYIIDLRSSGGLE
ncbi:MAG: hypothetical protein HZB61_10205 [Nitrospirae bacterium]|nr:hypothetical protein [Nitrospirota bacterium]